MHLPSLLTALSFQCLLFAAGFLYFGSQERWGSGSRWWVIAAIISPLAVTLLAEAKGPGNLMFWSGYLLVHLDSWVHWSGMRAHMGLASSRRNLLLVLMFAALSLSVQAIEPVQLGRLIAVGFYLLSVTCTSTLIYRDASAYRRRSGKREMIFLERTSIFEVFLAAAVALYLWIKPPLSEPDTNWFLALLLIYMLAMTIRMSSYFVIYISDLQNLSRQDRQALQSSRAELAALIENLGAGVVVLAADQRIVLSNRAALAFFQPLGLAAGGDRLPIGGWRTVDGDGRALAPENTPLMEVFRSRRPLSDAVLGLSASGQATPSWGLFNAFPTFAAQGQLDQVVLTFVDITALKTAQAEQKALQQRLADASRIRSLGALAGGIAHDFNNILTSILGQLELLIAGRRNGSMAGDDRRSQYMAMQAAARRGRELVRQILNFDRQHPAKAGLVDPRLILNESASLLRAHLPAGIELRVANGAGGAVVSGDATQLIQVLMNLGNNAIQACSPGPGLVELMLDYPPLSDPALSPLLVREWHSRNAVLAGAVRLQVRDNGSGISANTLQHIFEPFFTTKSQGEGTGLGLAVVQGIIESHCGAIDVTSSPGKGSQFTVWLAGLPVDAAQEPAATGAYGNPAGQDAGREPASTAVSLATTTVTPTAVQLLADPASSALRILYVDDEPAVGEVVAALLQHHGHHCTYVNHPQKALQQLRSPGSTIDLLMTDFRMPEMNGLELAGAALQLNPGMPIVVLSGYVDESLEQQGKALGVRSLMLKADAIENIASVISAITRPSRP